MIRRLGHSVASVSQVAALVAALAVVPLSGCADKADSGWKTPADEASLAKLEAASQQKGLSRARRAQLFFLWGQELAEKDGDRAIAAFERVVDLGSILVDESRFNLEILWRQKERQQSRDQQDQKNSQGQSGKDGQQDQKNSQDQNGQQNRKNRQGKQDEKNGQDKPGQSDQQSQSDKSKDGQERSNQSDADKSKPKDLSALVRDREQSSDLDKALKAELERRSEQQTAQAGGVAPVEKDW